MKSMESNLGVLLHTAHKSLVSTHQNVTNNYIRKLQMKYSFQYIMQNCCIIFVFRSFYSIKKGKEQSANEIEP